MRSFELLGPPLLAIGFSFHNAGLKPDALDWMQRGDRTWLFRAASAPSRLLGRSFRYNALSSIIVLHDAIAAPRA